MASKDYVIRKTKISFPALWNSLNLKKMIKKIKKIKDIKHVVNLCFLLDSLGGGCNELKHGALCLYVL